MFMFGLQIEICKVKILPTRNRLLLKVSIAAGWKNANYQMDMQYSVS